MFCGARETERARGSRATAIHVRACAPARLARTSIVRTAEIPRRHSHEIAFRRAPPGGGV